MCVYVCLINSKANCLVRSTLPCSRWCTRQGCSWLGWSSIACRGLLRLGRVSMAWCTLKNMKYKSYESYVYVYINRYIYIYIYSGGLKLIYAKVFFPEPTQWAIFAEENPLANCCELLVHVEVSLHIRWVSSKPLAIDKRYTSDSESSFRGGCL